jgi:glutamate-1-semialdehyde aminotransferase
MFTTFFNAEPVNDWTSAAKSDREVYGKFFHAMLQEGVYLAPSQFEATFLGIAHTDELINRTIEAARKLFALSEISDSQSFFRNSQSMAWNSGDTLTLGKVYL